MASQPMPKTVSVGNIRILPDFSMFVAFIIPSLLADKIIFLLSFIP